MSEEEILRAIRTAIDGHLVRSETPIPSSVDLDVDLPFSIPAGWGAPQQDITVLQQQYADAANRAEEAARATEAIVSDWRNMLLRPLPIDAMFMAAHLTLGRVLADVEQNGHTSTPCDDCRWIIHDDTVRLVRAYSSAMLATDVALTDFLQWALAILAQVEHNDETANRIAHNLRAAGLLDGSSSDS